MNIKIENWKLLIVSIFYVIFAVISYMIPQSEFLNFFQIAGIAIVLIGLFQVLVYFFKKEYLKSNDFTFSWGVLTCIAGLIVAIKPNVIVDNYPLVISGLVVLDSTLRLQFSMNLLRLQDSQWTIHIGLAIVPMLIGLSLILFTFDSKLLHNIFSFLLFLDAVANVYTVLYYKHIVKTYGDNSDEILDLSKKDKCEHECIDGEANLVEKD
ncbi:MAG: DUF308 domain-containing protein [Longicatena sp.]